jgi:hypothetical protein
MPELARLVYFVLVEFVFEGAVAVAEELVEGGFVLEGGEVEGLTRREDYGLLGEVTIVWVIQAICRFCEPSYRAFERP